MSVASRIAEAADALRPLADEIADLQIFGFWNDNPTPPTLDIYPGDPFQSGAAFRPGDVQLFLTCRARVAMADSEAGQQLLYRMLDTADPASVEVALAEVDWVVVADGVSGFTQYPDDVSAVERMLGCEWRVTTFL